MYGLKQIPETPDTPTGYGPKSEHSGQLPAGNSPKSVDIRAEIERRCASDPPPVHRVWKPECQRGWEREGFRRECGAPRRLGRGLCRSTALYANGRCWLHGGPSTGPRTAEGLAITAVNLAKFNADRAARKPETVIARLATEGCSLAEIAARVPTWSAQQLRDFLFAEERRNG